MKGDFGILELEFVFRFIGFKLNWKEFLNMYDLGESIFFRREREVLRGFILFSCLLFIKVLLLEMSFDIRFLSVFVVRGGGI